MVEIIEIKKTDLDEDFRRKVRMLLDSAEKEIVVITGEFSGFGFHDLRWATERAIERGAKFRMYATSPIPEFLNKVLMLGGEVYVGKKKTKDHFLVVDEKNWISSKEHPSMAVGKRWGKVHLNDRKGAKRILAEFNDLTRGAERIKKLRDELDPLTQAIESPQSWGVKTDARKFREELFG